jgi:Tol biopolymer transport system component
MNDTPLNDLRRLEIDASPDPAFVSRSVAVLLATAGESRRQDASFVGRLRRVASPATTGFGRGGAETWRLLRGPVIVLLLLALLLGALITVGALLRTPTLGGVNGLAVTTFGGELTAIDTTDGSQRTLLPDGTKVAGVSRSPDGSLVTYWTDARRRLEVMEINGTGRRQLAASVDIQGARCFDVWSPDSRRVAAEVLGDDGPGILVVDVATGDARIITDPRLAAGCPLWSPDGRFLAIGYAGQAEARRIGVIGADGSGFHDVGGELDGRSVGGANSWSPDGAWVYFDASDDSGGRLFRANVAGRFSNALTIPGISAFAPALSPDGSQVSFIVDRSGTFDLYAARDDGEGAHLVLADASNEGWSTDSAFILTRWAPPQGGGGLAIVRPDGTGREVHEAVESYMRSRYPGVLDPMEQAQH